MSRVTRKEKKQDFINDENKEVKKDITTKTNAVSTQKTKIVLIRKALLNLI